MRWLVASLASIVAHLCAAGLIFLAVDPDMPEPAPRAETTARITSYKVDRNTAQERAPDADTLDPLAERGRPAGRGSIPERRAEAAALPSVPAPGQQTGGQRIEANIAMSTQLAARQPQMQQTAAAAPTGQRLSETTKVEAVVAAKDIDQTARVAAPVAATGSRLNVREGTGQKLALATPSGTPLTATDRDRKSVRATPVQPSGAGQADAGSIEIASLSLSAAASKPTGASLAASRPDALRSRARDAVLLGQELISDPDAVAALSVFVNPEAAEARRARNQMDRVLAATSCARVSLQLDPQTGGLVTQGHVPDAATRETLLSNLGAEIGPALEITDQTELLPFPQCDALTRIAALDLPQSSDQFTDARIVGQRSHARSYAYREGDSLVFDLETPDYPAFLYVDYFDADGQVIHLLPNDRAPVQIYAPQRSLKIGDGHGLGLRIGPPFGQEIAVAFASSTRLFSEPRPIIEPASQYLSQLDRNIAAARARNPAFKGEWVYFFIETRPAR